LVWEKLNYLFKNDDYVDSYFSEEDIEMLHRLTQVAPKTIENLKGLTLSQQVSIMKNMFDKYKEDPIVAISIMEKMKLDPNKEFDDCKSYNNFVLSRDADQVYISFWR
jgi:hypothetical protein